MSGKKKKLISILIPAYNSECYIIATIDSLITQTYSNFECLILDDGSKDNTYNVIKEKIVGDTRFKLFKQENQGVIISRNRLLKKASGDYIALLDADDLCREDRLEKQFDFLEKNTQIDICGTQIEYIGEKNGVSKHLPLDNEEIKACMVFYPPVANPSVMFRKKVVKKLEYDTSLKSCEDYDFWYRASKNFKFANLNEPLVLYRIHSAQESSKNELRQRDAQVNISVKYLLGEQKDEQGQFRDFMKAMIVPTECVNSINKDIVYSGIDRVLSSKKDVSFSLINKAVNQRLSYKICSGSVMANIVFYIKLCYKTNLLFDLATFIKIFKRW